MTKEGKTHRSSCPCARALEIIGDRWSLLLIRESVFNGRREYGDFLQMIEGISTNVLASRLDWLVETGLFTKHRHPTNKKKSYYEITEMGFELLPALMELSRWGRKYIEDSEAPPEFRKSYNKDAKSFKRHWKNRVRERSREYLREAGSVTR